MKLPRALRRRARGLRFPNGIPRTLAAPAPSDEAFHGVIADCRRAYLDKWTPGQPVRELDDHDGAAHDLAAFGQVYVRVPAPAWRCPDERHVGTEPKTRPGPLSAADRLAADAYEAGQL